MRVCTCVCAQDLREITSISAAGELGGERGSGAGVLAWRGELARWVSGMEKCFNLGTAASGAAHRDPQITS